MKRRKVIHVCAACKAEFKTKRECWWHMDTECQEIEKLRELRDYMSEVKDTTRDGFPCADL